MEITEKMRQAFYEATEITSVGSVRNLDAGLRAALSAAPVAAKAKPLDWRVFCGRSGNRDAKTPFGEYVVQSETANTWQVWFPGNQDEANLTRGSAEEAEAAAQADYERRILSALSPAPVSEPEPVAWRFRYKGGKWTVQKNKPAWYSDGMPDCELEPLFTAPPSTERMREALTELLDACEKDCGVPTEIDEDDEPVGAGQNDDGSIKPMALTFGMLRRARAALADQKGGAA